MKKYFLILFLLTSFASLGQRRILAGYKVDSPDSLMPMKYVDTVIPLPNSINKYFTGFGTFGNFLDTARSAITLTTTGTSGASTYTTATGVLNIPQYTSGGAADSAYFWQLIGNAPAYGKFLGTTISRSLRFRTNNIERASIDSNASTLNIWSGTSPSNDLILWRNNSIATKCMWFSVEGDDPYISTIGSPVIFRTVSSGTVESFRVTQNVPTATIASGDAATLVGRMKSKIGVPATDFERSYAFSVASTGGITRLNLGLDSSENGIIGLTNVGLSLTEDNLASNRGTLLKTFNGTGNVLIKNKGTITQNEAARLEVSAINQGVLFPTLTTTQVNNMVGSIIFGATTAGAGYTDGVYAANALTGGTGSGATANVTVAGGIVVLVELVNRGTGYTNNDALGTSGIGGGTGFVFTVGNSTIPGTVGSIPTGLMLNNGTANTTYYYNGTAWKSVGTISGSFSGVGTATTVFTVTFGGTQPNATYKVLVTPTAALSAALFYVTNKTTTTFDVTYLAGLTGTVTLDWAIFQ